MNSKVATIATNLLQKWEGHRFWPACNHATGNTFYTVGFNMIDFYTIKVYTGTIVFNMFFNS
jgi:hypothetical protein